MTRICDIYNYIDSFAPFSTAMDFDNTGLLIGNENKDVHCALVALDVTSSVIEVAKKHNAELIITHHPVIFNGLKSIPDSSVAYKLISNGISVISAHTNLDLSVGFGVNTCLAEKLALNNPEFPIEGLPIVTGFLSHAMPADEFVEKVKLALCSQNVRASLYKGMIHKVAVGGGACGEYVDKIPMIEADAFVTGELKHHEFLYAAEHEYLAVDAGHYNTENVVIEPLSAKLKEKFADVEFISVFDCKPYK